jgi:hypothetical protein
MRVMIARYADACHGAKIGETQRGLAAMSGLFCYMTLFESFKRFLNEFSMKHP